MSYQMTRFPDSRARRSLLLCAFAATFAFAFHPAKALAQNGVDNNNIFELDGNTQDDAGFPGQDWETPSLAGPKTAIPIFDPAPQSIFTTGGSKDTNDVTQWKWRDGSVPDKDNLTHAAALGRNLPNGDLAIYFTAARYNNNGDAQMGFWFLQGGATPTSDGKFGNGVVSHVDGDILILVDFVGGGLNPEFDVFKWIGGANGSAVPVTNLNVGVCNNSSSLDGCAITNAADSPAPASWLYTPKFGTSGTFPAQSFFEGALNLSKVFGTVGSAGLPCFTSFLAETRSSASITAQLKDFVEGTFLLCKISMTKSCSPGQIINNGTQVMYSFGGLVSNDGPGPVFDVIVEDTLPGSNTPVTYNVASSIISGGTANWSGDFTGTQLSFTNMAVAKAKSSALATERTVISDAVTAPCTTTVENTVSITKACTPGTSLVDIGNNVAVQVGVSGMVCNNGNSRLTGITLADTPGATATSAGSMGPFSLNPGDCTSWAGNYQPADISSGNGSVPGRYFFDDTIKVTAATAVLGTNPSPVQACGGALACDSKSCAMCPLGTCPIP